MPLFEGFSGSDFHAFDESKWSSHAFNRERLEVKLKLTALGKDVAGPLQEKVPDQEMGVSEERPSIFNQHCVRDMALYFTRSEQTRHELGSILDKALSMADNVQDPAHHHRHMLLGLRIHQRGAVAGLWLHENAWVDWKNLVQRCREHWDRERFGEVLAGLPEDILYSRGATVPAQTRRANLLQPGEVIEDFSRQGPWTFFGRSLERSEPVLASPDLAGILLGLFGALAELHAFIGWRRDNDFHDLKGAIKEQKQKARIRFSSLQAGDQVRVLKGLAAGRVGVVDSIEHKGTVKIRLGTMVIAVKIEELGQP